MENTDMQNYNYVLTLDYTKTGDSPKNGRSPFIGIFETEEAAVQKAKDLGLAKADRIIACVPKY